MTVSDKPISVIIVGAGFGGLGTAIECASRGMHVQVYEKYLNSNNHGDILDIFPNAGSIIKRWNDGKVGQEIHDTGCNMIRSMEIHKYDGKYLAESDWARNEKERDITYAGHRGNMHSIIMAYAKTVVPELYLGVGVTEYLEKEDQAGVVLSTGETVWADCVIAADGARSIARQTVLGLDDDRQDTNWATFRTFFSLDEKARSQLAAHGLLHDDRDLVRFWMSDNLSLMCFVWNRGRDIAWTLIHPDDKESLEGWGTSNVADRDHLTKWMEPFTGKDARTLLDITPEGKTIDFKLVYRPTLSTWTSNGGRIILIGDAAHANLPTAGQGASQALEDAVTVAHCLKESGGDVKLALEATQRIRYHRSNAVHKSGGLNRDAVSKTNWEEIEADPQKFVNRRWNKLKPWDPLAFVQENFPKVAGDIKKCVAGSLDDVAVPPPEGGFWQAIPLDI